MSNIQPWEEIRRQQAFKKYSRVVDEVIFKLPNGDESDFYIKKEGPASCTVAFTSEGEVILVRQFRPGPQKVLLELPGGYVDLSEDPKDTAAREFLEETGYKGDFEFVGTSLDDAYSTMVRYCFVAKNCVKVQEPENTSTEQTEVMLVSVEKFRQLLRSGEMTDVEVGYLGLDYLKLL